MYLFISHLIKPVQMLILFYCSLFFKSVRKKQWWFRSSVVLDEIYIFMSTCRFLSCLNTNFLCRLWTPSPQLTSPNPHSSPSRLPEETCILPCIAVNAVQRVHWVPLSFLFFFFCGEGVVFCRLPHAFQLPILHFSLSFTRMDKQCWQSGVISPQGYF